MSAAKHTPGPWHWVNATTDQPRQPGEFRASLRTVAEFRAGKPLIDRPLPKFILEADEICDENMEANARLIAAAPELLEALRALYVSCPTSLKCDDFHHSKQEQHQSGEVCKPLNEFTSALRQARTAIAKATGSQP